MLSNFQQTIWTMMVEHLTDKDKEILSHRVTCSIMDGLDSEYPDINLPELVATELIREVGEDFIEVDMLTIKQIEKFINARSKGNGQTD